MFQTVTKTMKWVPIPVLLIASLFSYYAASYEPMVNSAVCLCVIIFVQRAVWLREYFWAAGFLAIGVAFSPLPLVIKLFIILTGFTCYAIFSACLAVFRTEPVTAD